MAHLLTPVEAMCVGDSFLRSLYGDETFSRWKELKDEMQFVTEKEYVSWLIEVAWCYRKDDSEVYSANGGEYSIGSKMYSVESICNPQNYDNLQRTELTTPSASCTNHTKVTSEDKTASKCEIKPIECDVPKPLSELFQLKSSGKYSETKLHNYQLSGCDVRQLERTNQSDSIDYLLPNKSSKNNKTLSQEIIILSDGDEHENINQMAGASTDLPSNNRGEILNDCLQDLSPKKYQCSECSYVSNRNSDLKRHINIIHDHLKPFPCKSCQYRFPTKNSLKYHLITKHGYTSNYSCHNCGKYFPKPSALQKHQLGFKCYIK